MSSSVGAMAMVADGRSWISVTMAAGDCGVAVVVSRMGRVEVVLSAAVARVRALMSMSRSSVCGCWSRRGYLVPLAAVLDGSPALWLGGAIDERGGGWGGGVTGGGVRGTGGPTGRRPVMTEDG